LYSGIQFVIGVLLLSLAQEHGVQGSLASFGASLAGLFTAGGPVILYVLLNFAVAAAAFGIHIDQVGSWMAHNRPVPIKSPRPILEPRGFRIS
jgi:hypothetical protein